LPLRQRVEERRRVAADALRVCPTPERPSQPLALPPARHPSIAPWVVSGAGGLAFASGALLAQARHDLAQADPDVVSARREQAQARRSALGASAGRSLGAPSSRIRHDLILRRGDASWGIKKAGVGETLPRVRIPPSP